MSLEIKQIPAMYSLELPSLRLVYNISPFPAVSAIKITGKPYAIGQDQIWIELMKGTYGLFLKSELHQRCPTCGRELNE
jgi:hypothetical protein